MRQTGDAIAAAAEPSRPRVAAAHVPRVALVGAVVAGVGTQFENVLAAAEGAPSLAVSGVPVRPYAADRLERWLPFVPSSTRGTLRSVWATRPLFVDRRLDMVWTQIDLPLLPWLTTVNAVRRIPVIYTADSTPALLRRFGGLYPSWTGGSRLKTRARDLLHAAVLRRATIVNAWTSWAARSMREDYGVPEERIVVLPPGVDTAFWTPSDRVGRCRTPRILFVGGDFYRKGGDVLVSVWRERLRGRALLDVVSAPRAVQEEPGLTLHAGIEPNDPRLATLYRDADVAVIPTRADCFSMAGLEALASGLPVVTCRVGGVAELLEDATEGMYVEPGDGRSLAVALERLVDDAGLRLRMGAAARRLALDRYDATVNSHRLLALLAEARS